GPYGARGQRKADIRSVCPIDPIRIRERLMSNTAVRTRLAEPRGGIPRAGKTAEPGSAGNYLHHIVSVLASLRVTVFLFVLSFILVFAGTLAQIDQGIFTTVNEYFRTLWVWIPYQLFVEFGQVFFGVPRTASVAGSFPFPGGWLLGGLLLVN